MNFIIILQDKLYIKHCSLTSYHSLFLSADDLVYIGVLGVHTIHVYLLMVRLAHYMLLQLGYKHMHTRP